jgi:hypothetical protein
MEQRERGSRFGLKALKVVRINTVGISSEVFTPTIIKIVVFWIVTPYSFWEDTDVSEKHAASIFKVEICRFKNRPYSCTYTLQP